MTHCKDCPLRSLGYNNKAETAKYFLSIAEVEFEPYSVDVWLDTDRPIPNREDEFGNDLIGWIFGGARWGRRRFKHCKHKFRISVERCEDD